MEYLNNVLPFIHAEADDNADPLPGGNEPPKKRDLTEDEKKLFNETFRDRYAEIQEKARKDAAKAVSDREAALRAEFAAELEKVKLDKNGEENAEAKRILADYKKSIADREAQIGLLNEKVSGKDKEIHTMRKDAAITDALSGIPFVNLKQVKQLTGSDIEFDSESNKWVVRNEHGDIVQGDDFKPLTLKEYYTQYASQNPHLVKSEMKPGVGSTPNIASGAVGKFAHVKSKADLQGSANMKLRIAFVTEKGLAAYEALPAK